MSILNRKQIDSLTYEEKVSLIDDLYSSLDSSEATASVGPAYYWLLERRLADRDAQFDQLITLDRASRELREMLRGFENFPTAASGVA